MPDVIDDLKDILDSYIGESTLDPALEEAICLDVLSYLAGKFPGRKTSVQVSFDTGQDRKTGAAHVVCWAGAESWALGISRDDTKKG